MLEGHAGTEGTMRYRERFAPTLPVEHFRRCQGLWLSSIGLGSYLGREHEADDRAYTAAARLAIALGANVLDTAINYRAQRSERALGRAVASLVAEGGVARDELLVCTKGGYLPFDESRPGDPAAYVDEAFIRPGLVKKGELAAGCHCIAPAYLEDQLERSRRNLGLETVDVYYVHNPEHQLEEFGEAAFRARLRAAFTALEGAAGRGLVRRYGLATWQGFREPAGAPCHLGLQQVLDLAREAGGDDHHFGFVQLPVNLAMPEAVTLRNQTVDGRDLTMVEAADRLGVTLVASASLLQGRLVRGLSEGIAHVLDGLRSTPGVGVALAGMKTPEHVEENLRVGRVPPASMETYFKLFAGAGPA